MKKKKEQKPIDIDVSLKYKCPNNTCGFDHWLFLREAKTKNFKIVCDCGTSFKPKRIKIIQVVYDTSETVKKTLDSEDSTDKIDSISECVNRAIKMMISLGYSRKNAQEHIMAICENEKITDATILVKKAISNIGGI